MGQCSPTSSWGPLNLLIEKVRQKGHYVNKGQPKNQSYQVIVTFDLTVLNFNGTLTIFIFIFFLRFNPIVGDGLMSAN